MFNRITKTSKQIVLFFDSSFVFVSIIRDTTSQTILGCFEHSFRMCVFCLARKVKEFTLSPLYPKAKELIQDNRDSAISLSDPLPITKHLVRLR